MGPPTLRYQGIGWGHPLSGTKEMWMAPFVPPLPRTGRRSMLERCRRDGRRQGRMRVVLAEKPSVARELASFLGATQRHDGYYEGRGYQVAWALGHLVTLIARPQTADVAGRLPGPP